MSARRLSATGRVALAIALVLAAAIALLTLLAYLVTASSLSQELDGTLARETEAYAASIEGDPAGESLLQATREYLGARTGEGLGPDPLLVAIFNDGRVISNSTAQLERAEGNTAAQTPATSTAGYENVHFEDRTFRVMTTPIVDASGTQIGVFQAALSISEPQRVARNVAAVVGGVGLIVFGVGLLVSLWASRESLRPLRVMAEDAATITHGTPDRRIAYEGPPDELGSLAQSVNEMLDRLQAGSEEQRRFVADASHELRTPLAIVRGSAELAEAPGTSGADRSEALALIVEESARMGRLIDDMLALARLDEAPTNKVQEVHAPTLVEEAAARARTLTEASVVGVCETDDAWVMADPDQLEQAVLNLVRNAVRAAGPRGTLTVACRRQDEWVDIVVADDGPGIPEEDLDRVFDRFFRGSVHRASAGTADGAGLGLAITKRLAELQGGSIEVANAEPHGAVFTIRLPRIPAPLS